MANPGVNNGRRRFLTASTAVVGAVGAGLVAVPFVKSWLPSARAQLAGAPTEVDISRIDNEPGMLVRAEWRGQPIFVFKRSERQIEALPGLEGRLADPASDNADFTPAWAKNQTRSLTPEIGVLVGICTHLGCVPLHRPEVQPQPWDANWQGGFFCPCHNSFYDLAGRVYQGMPAPDNLRVPPYRFVGDDVVLIGEAPEGAA
ncbi:ubiquinol-cytochrome c reductase iron-sulfur subunit [Coralloluteibacterium thermophilus]|uniref:Ubiquinol-cytochrome c reductase iron-sulfur subunit n=1 Tax=Coralloluteibacterium thermophilum TaxID=2707049 RepID=A0ABV9NKL1_9GAMM